MVHCTVMAKSPLKRRRRPDGFAVRAESAATQHTRETGRLPTQRELRAIVGGGSTRDIVAAIHRAKITRVVQVFLEPVEEPSANDVLRQRVANLMAENAALRGQEAENEARVRGLERHLLMETARLRDQLIEDAAERSRGGGLTLFSVGRPSIVRPDIAEDIFD